MKQRRCLVAPASVKCGSCGQYCSFRPNNDGAKSLERLSGVYKVLDAVLEARNMHPDVVRKSMRDLARVGARWGCIEVDGQKIDEGV